MNRSFLKLAVALLIIILTLHLLFYEIYDCKCSKGKLQDLEISTNIPTMKIHRSYDEKCWVPRPYLDNLCKCYPEGLVGLESKLNTLAGGITSFEISNTPNLRQPKNCTSRQEIVIIIPYRDRLSHLKIFLKRLTTVLDRQHTSYRILVVEQNLPLVFNKAMVMNSGFIFSARRWPHTDCFIFHDVDLLPENDHNLYSCRESSMLHLAPYVNTLNYNFFYEDLLGGATAFTSNQFRLANGFTNTIYGWGAEDDDLASRLKAVSLNIFRENKTVGRYTMIRHNKDHSNPHLIRNITRYRNKEHVDVEGLNTVKFEVANLTEYDFFTKIEINIPEMPKKDMKKFKQVIT